MPFFKVEIEKKGGSSEIQQTAGLSNFNDDCFLEISAQNLAPDKNSGWYDVISGCPITSFKVLNYRRKSKKQPKMAINYISFVTSALYVIPYLKALDLKFVMLE